MFEFPRWAGLPGKYHATIRVSATDVLTFGWDKKRSLAVVKFTGFETRAGNTRTQAAWLAKACNMMINHAARQTRQPVVHGGKVDERQIREYEERRDGIQYKILKIPIYLNAPPEKQKWIVVEIQESGMGKFSHSVSIPPLWWAISERGNLAALVQFEHVCWYTSSLLQTERPGFNPRSP